MLITAHACARSGARASRGTVSSRTSVGTGDVVRRRGPAVRGGRAAHAAASTPSTQSSMNVGVRSWRPAAAQLDRPTAQRRPDERRVRHVRPLPGTVDIAQPDDRDALGYPSQARSAASFESSIGRQRTCRRALGVLLHLPRTPRCSTGERRAGCRARSHASRSSVVASAFARQYSSGRSQLACTPASAAA